MTDFSFFTTLQAGLLNAWIPSFGMVLIQFIYMAVFKEGGKRAVDTSWYTGKDKINASVSTILQIAILVLSVFVPFKFGTAWFLTGTVIYMLSLAVFAWSFHCYANAPTGKTIQGGIYRWSRNPMYFFFFTGMLGVCIASASLWMLLALIPFAISTHFIILGEERYCENVYGEEYRKYKSKTPRYFLFL